MDAHRSLTRLRDAGDAGCIRDADAVPGRPRLVQVVEAGRRRLRAVEGFGGHSEAIPAMPSAVRTIRMTISLRMFLLGA